MRPLPLVLALFPASVALAAGAAKSVVKEGDGFRITLASSWAPLPDIEKEIASAMPPDVSGGAVAWGDSAAGAALQVMWVQSKEPSPKGVREELEAFHETLRVFLETSGSKTTSFELTERGNRLTARHEFEAAESVGQPVPPRTLQLSSAGVGRDGRTRSWSAQCVWQSEAGKAACEKALASFTVTAAPSSFRPLSPKEKK